MDDGDDEDEYDDDDEINTSKKFEAPEYTRLISIHAGKPKGGLSAALKVDPDKIRRLSLSEQQLEKAASRYGKEIVRYVSRIIFC